VASLDEAMGDRHFRDRGLFRYAVEDAGRDLPMTALPVAPGLRRPPEIERPVAGVGENTREVVSSGKG